MAMAQSAADAAWDEMRGTGVAVDVTRLLRKSMASTTATSRTTTTTTTIRNATGRGTSTAVLASHAPVQHADTHTATDRPLVPHEPFSLARELNRLADERASVRKQAAAALEAQLLQTDADAPRLLDGMRLSELAKPLFKRFNDPVEKVRDVSIRLTAALLPTEPDLLRVLPYLMPAISNRLNSTWGYDEENHVFTRDAFLHDAFKRGRVFVAATDVARVRPSEPSEEIRLQFLTLIATLLDQAFTRQAASILHAYVFDIVLLLVAAVHDDFHEVNIQACTVLEQLCGHMVSVMKHFTIAFVRACTRLLRHRLARVRVAAVHCVRALVACPNFEKCKGSGTEAIVDLLGHRDENVIPIAAFYAGDVRVNCFAKLDQDANASVRTAFYAMIMDWMLHLPDRFDHESRLLPYVLSAVSDELDENAQHAMATLAELGKRYEHEHGEDVLELKQYGVDGAHQNPRYNYRKLLPAPFGETRPSLGTRLFVRGRTRRFLNPILRELVNWQSPTRAHAVRLLKCVIVYSEETITVDAHVLLQTLLKTWDHDDAREIRVHLEEIADLVGRFVEPKTYLPLLLARVRGDNDALVGSAVSPDQLAVALDVLRCVVGGSLEKTVLPHVAEIVDALTCETVAAFETARIKKAQIALAHQLTALLQRRGHDAVSAFFLEHGRLTSLERVFDRLFELCIALSAEATSGTDIVDLATATLTMLCGIESRDSLAALYDAHFDACFVRAATHVADLSPIQWTPQSIDQLVVDQLLRHATPAFLMQSPQRATQLHAHFQSMLHESHDGDVDEAADDPRKRRGHASSSSRAGHYQQLLRLLTERLPRIDDDVEGFAAWQALLAMATEPSDSTTALENATAA